MINAIVLWFWAQVFAAKCRAGFKLLEFAIVRGTVVGMPEISSDGDTCFDIIPDPGFESLLEYSTGGARHVCQTIHCEVAPADQRRLRPVVELLRSGSRVSVAGTRAWDGAHHGHGTLFDVLMVLLRAAPTLDGWIEIHPVQEITVLT